jgi:hypothetical protein
MAGCCAAASGTCWGGLAKSAEHRAQFPEPDVPHGDGTAWLGGRTRRLDRLKFMFFRDALIWFAIALEAVLEFAVAFGKLRQNFITAWRGITQPSGLTEADRPPNRKAMTDDPGLVKLAHNVT